MKSEYVLIHAAPIKHYGIKGQKKGVRRFQLDNGQLTAAGKIRYYNSKDFYDDHYEKNKNGGRPYTTPYDYESPEEKAQRAMKNAKMAPTLASYDRFNKAYSKAGGAGHVAMEKASKVAGIKGRALTGALGKKVDKKASTVSTETSKTSDSWGKRVTAVNEKPPITGAKKETKDNLGNNGGRPYSTPYTQETAKGRRKNFNGFVSAVPGATAHKKTGINAAKASDSAYATMAKAINPVEKANAKAEAQHKKQEEVDIKRNNALESAAYNSQTKYGEPKSKHEIGSGTVSAMSKAARTVSSKPKDNTPKSKTSDDSAKNKNTSKSETKTASKNEKQKDSYTPASNNYVENPKSKLDNGAVDTLKKKDLVKIRSGKNTRR